MRDSNNCIIDKQSKKIKKVNQIILEELGNNCKALLYYKDGILKKSKVFQIPHKKDLKKMMNRQINKEYHLWIHTLWQYGNLEEDDIQFMDKSS